MRKDKLIKYVLIFMFSLSFYNIFKGLNSSNSNERPRNYNVNVTQVITADKGLNLEAVGELLKESKNAEEFEKLLNDKKTGVNNLDLNGDGTVDYIKVTEFGSGDIRGFSLSTEPSPGEEQEIATIKIAKQSEEKSIVETQGNTQIYGPGHYYQSSWSGLGTGMLLGYLFSSHRPFSSPYSYGYPPAHYSPHSTVSQDQYHRQNSSRLQNSSSRFSKTGNFNHISSPNSGKSANSIKTPLKNPSSSQKSFQTRTSPRKSSSGGFGNKRSSSSKFKKRVSRGRSGFGGMRRRR